MEVPNGNYNKGLICLYEAFGTGLILYSVNISAVGNKDPPSVAFAILCIVIILSPVCGCHFNGAVTLGVLFKDNGKFKDNLISAIQIIIS
jgi:glycerol uptake facilitator-like aquaporin